MESKQYRVAKNYSAHFYLTIVRLILNTGRHFTYQIVDFRPVH